MEPNYPSTSLSLNTIVTPPQHTEREPGSSSEDPLEFMFQFFKKYFAHIITLLAAIFVYKNYFGRQNSIENDAENGEIVRLREENERKMRENEERLETLRKIRTSQEEESLEQLEEISKSINQKRNGIAERSIQYFLRSKHALEEETEREREEGERNMKRWKADVEADGRKHEEQWNREKNRIEEKSRIEIGELEDERRRDREKFDRKQKQYEDNSLRQKQEFAEAEENHRRVMQKEKEDFDEKLRQIKEELRREEYESARKWRERQQEADRQFAQIMRILQFRAWNDAIERNWTNRLNFLRSANREVERNFDRLRSRIPHLEKDSRNADMIKQFTKSLIQSLESEKRLMADEASNMEQMYQNTGKLFLKVIKESVSKVEKQCESAITLMRKYHRNPTTDNRTIQEIVSCFSSLRREALDIPTLAMLKQQHSEDMKHQEGENSRYDSTYPEQTVIIEEVD